MMMERASLFCLFTFLAPNLIVAKEYTAVMVVKSVFRDLIDCTFYDDSTTQCMEDRTTRNIHNLNTVLKPNLDSTFSERSGKNIDVNNNNNDDDDAELENLKNENFNMVREIQNRTVESRGLIDELSEFLTYLTSKFLSPFMINNNDDDGKNNNSNEVVEG